MFPKFPPISSKLVTKAVVRLNGYCTDALGEHIGRRKSGAIAPQQTGEGES
ncbi:hypothetical protein [Oscillatoria sp. HE19RPO]|uniref:hypothetical protein n=1 Tax=Oscillatoria sp. HE19RPO TaxID=2954806 RepID=UPI0020C4FDDC|nr:hypothetical protein [Oscillatoria sp. HE19RPO]